MSKKKQKTDAAKEVKDEETVQAESAETRDAKAEKAESGSSEADMLKKLAEAASQVESLEARLEQAKTQYVRLQADFDNFRRRTREEQARLSHTVTANVMKEILPVLDNMDRAMDHMEKDEKAGPYIEGYALIQKGLKKVLSDFGVKEIDAAGKAFDPHVHEAVMEVQSDDVDEDTVAMVFQKGYTMDDTVLRPAKVQVAHK
jgi:molecular chaperone GrpE